MTKEGLKEILDWMRGTDLVSVDFKEGGRGFSLSLPGGIPDFEPAPSPFVPVTSPTVGIFRASALGRGAAAEGSSVEKGAVLGFVESAGGRKTPVEAPDAGRLTKIFIHDSDPVEYGKLLFFLTA